MKRARLLLPLAVLLASCGMYGSLYLEDEANGTTPEATDAPVNGEETDDADDRDEADDEEDPAGGS